MAKRGFNHLPAVIRAVEPGAGAVVEKIVTDIAAQAGARAPIDTGALAASYYAEMEMGRASGIAGTNMEYGPHVEYGTIHTGAQPHLVPATDDVDNKVNMYAQQLGIRIERAARGG